MTSTVPRRRATTQRLWWNTTELLIGAGATLDVAGLQDFDQDTIAVISRFATMGEDAHLQWALASVGAQLHRSRIDNLLVGRGSSVHQVEIGFGDGSQLFDLTSYTRHIGTDTTGDLLSKGVFTDRARGYIKGLIEIRQTRDRHRQLPRRVQHAAGQAGSLGHHPQPRDRPAERATGRPLELRRSHRRGPDLLSREPRRGPGDRTAR